MNIAARYVDTCLSDYLQDGHTRDGETLCLASLGDSKSGTMAQLYESIDWDSGLPEAIPEGNIRTALFKALEGVDLRYIDANGERTCELDDDEAAEGPYVYVVLSWDAERVSLKMTVDVDYLANGADPYDLKIALERMVGTAAGQGLLTDGGAVVTSYGATAEIVKTDKGQR